MTDSQKTYIGRFAPSPTGPLHAGSLVAALASWLDARAHGGLWLVRVEDVDFTRNQPGAAERILQQLTACGLQPDQSPVWQSQREALYQRALDALIRSNHAYPCACSRADILAVLSAQGRLPARGQEAIYPGTCRNGLQGRRARSWRVRLPEDAGQPLRWSDRRLGAQSQVLSLEVGDFVLKRADGAWAYQLAVVVDDAAQGITDVVRGEDLAASTARQILLQRLLGLPTPRYLHTPLVRDASGEKLSKHLGAGAFEPGADSLRAALRVLDMPASAPTVAELLAAAVPAWQARWAIAGL
ncbi:MAG: tRNA glutamyl-Q(34) synthetase GluQRS [Thiomonas sp.]|uniref:tRNA glutamyl-Q(34) synthetase GluQRS n=1 Tax=Thiomonas sp. TaxID=2047785 RepID=UPI002A36DCAF|nr:tRNA glutamyl-Q(34) synthetase GluQRS [Thiomonas sp.]MDY0329432.1 tRNA glutamyl-Q(34) synthetase GluQRS [Thiomonas sp.]